ncbi:lasso RiPP family leader peptide-containing protein [Reyranella sp.]|uniref:lasso RiPP family leader peptide-containing protein n=1 Tax=Reyranella sp. TaxID=1929291 RepID=UPI00352693D0
MDAPPTNAANPGEPSTAKKAYEAPVLQRWGTLRDLTQQMGNTGGKDNWGNRKTR